jgi:hypothetical protein
MGNLMTRIRSAAPGSRWITLGSVVALAGVGMVAAAPAASAVPTTVVDCSADASALQPAIDAARPGATLAVIGTCVDHFTINKDLTLTASGGTATLNGGGGEGPVLIVRPGVGVTLDRLIITGGVGGGAGIFNVGGTVTLTGSTVTGNDASGRVGGGIYNLGGTVTMNGSTVTGNRAVDGGGIANAGGSTVIMNGSSTVTGNIALFAFGGIQNSGTVIMNGSSSVTDNDAATLSGGGIFNNRSAVLIMNGGSSVADNNAADSGGGISNFGTVTMNGNSTVTGNTAEDGRSPANTSGGGIDNNDGGTVTMNGTSAVTGNTTRGFGGGIANRGGGMVTMNGMSTVTLNLAGSDGGGIANFGGGLAGAVAGDNVRDNTPDDIVTF